MVSRQRRNGVQAGGARGRSQRHSQRLVQTPTPLEELPRSCVVGNLNMRPEMA